MHQANIYSVISSLVGAITISTDGANITGLHIEGDRYFTGAPAGWIRNEDQPLLRQAATQLSEYFAGVRTKFDLPLAPAGTPFQQQVWDALGRIPNGATVSYRDLAAQVDRPSAARAVGTAVGRNPICILIPCHRVLASDGTFGGYVAGISCKRQLLGLEGVTV